MIEFDKVFSYASINNSEEETTNMNLFNISNINNEMNNLEKMYINPNSASIAIMLNKNTFDIPNVEGIQNNPLNDINHKMPFPDVSVSTNAVQPSEVPKFTNTPNTASTTNTPNTTNTASTTNTAVNTTASTPANRPIIPITSSDNLIIPKLDQNENSLDSTIVPNSICAKEDQIINTQSQQLLMMVDIINSSNNEKQEMIDRFKRKETELHGKITTLTWLKNIIVMTFGLILIFAFMYSNRKELLGDKEMMRKNVQIMVAVVVAILILLLIGRKSLIGSESEEKK